MWIFDSTPLIYLSKSGRLDDLSAFEDKKIPKAVYNETVEAGKESGETDARRIDKVVKDGFEVKKAEKDRFFNRIKENPNLSDADAAVLALAIQLDATAVMDEKYGRSVAETEGIEHRGTAFLIISLVRNDEITGQEAKETVDQMIDHGWYCSTKLYKKIIKRIEEIQ